MSHERIYALVEDNHVVVYPLTVADINARANPVESYYPCFFGTQRPTPTCMRGAATFTIRPPGSGQRTKPPTSLTKE